MFDEPITADWLKSQGFTDIPNPYPQLRNPPAQLKKHLPQGDMAPDLILTEDTQSGWQLYLVHDGEYDGVYLPAIHGKLQLLRLWEALTGKLVTLPGVDK